MGIEFLIEPLKYDFMVRALITAFLSGIMLSVLGSFTINKNMGFMADAMAHATLPIIAVGVFFGFSVSSLGAPAAIIIALLLGFIIKNTNIGGRHLDRNSIFLFFCFRLCFDFST